MSKEGSVVVFDKNAESLEALVHVVECEPRFAKAAASWLKAGNSPYIVLGSTGGPKPEFFAMAARDLYHLLNEVLSKAATLLSAAPSLDSSASAIDERLNHRVCAAWSEIVALRSPAMPVCAPRFREPRAAANAAFTATAHANVANNH